jgi:hypothetical protein
MQTYKIFIKLSLTVLDTLPVFVTGSSPPPKSDNYLFKYGYANGISSIHSYRRTIMQLFKVTGHTIAGALLVTDKAVLMASDLAEVGCIATDEMRTEAIINSYKNKQDLLKDLEDEDKEAIFKLLER